MRATLRTLLILSLLLLGLLAGCQPKPEVTPEAVPTELPPDVPTVVPTPAIPLAIVVVPAEMDPARSDLYQNTVYELAQAAGYRFQVRNTLTAADLEPGLQVVIAAGADPGLAAMAAAAPGVQFLGLEIDGLTPGGNLSVVGAEAGRPDIPAFLAGYIAGMVSDDYRAGALIGAGSPNKNTLVAAYTNGMTFYCGLCNPYYLFWGELPTWQEIPADARTAEYPAYANVLLNTLGGSFDPRVIFVDPLIATPELLTHLNSSGASMIGAFAPPQRYSGWVASIQPDYLSALRAAWPELIAGRGGVVFPSALVLTDVNTEILTAGRQQLAEEVLGGLLDGSIGTGVNP